METVVEEGGTSEAPPMRTTPSPPRSRVRWLLIALPVGLLIAKAVAALADVYPLGADPAGQRALIEIGLAITSLVAAVALVAGLRIGWLLALWIVGWDLVVSLVRWWLGEPNYVVLALAALVAFLLTTREMQAAYGTRRVT